MSDIQQHKIAKLLQLAFSQLLQQDKLHLPEGAFVTVTEVQISASLQEAKLYVSTFHSKDAAVCFSTLREELPTIRRELSRGLSRRLRRMPKLQLIEDRREAEAQRLSDLIASTRPSS